MSQTSPAQSPAPNAFFTQRVKPFFQKHCIDCHGPDEQEGKLRLDTLPADFVTRQPAAKWVEVLDRLNLGEMPPADEPPPNADELIAVTDWIGNEMRRVQSLADSTGGRVLLRRLSRTEYTNTVRDLLKVSFIEGEGPMEMLPPDGTLQGFNKVSKALMLDPSLMETYFHVAEFVADRALATRPPRVPTRTLRFDFENIHNDQALKYQTTHRSKWVDAGGIFITEGGARTFAKLLHPYNKQQTPIDGEYIIRVRAGADPGKRGDPIYMDITKGAAGVLSRIRVDAKTDQPKVYEIRQVLDADLGGEFQVILVNGTRTNGENVIGRDARMEIDRLFNSGQKRESTQLRAQVRAEGAYDIYTRGRILRETLNLEVLPKLYLDYIEVEGPLNGNWPPESRRWLLAEALGEERWPLGEQSADGMSREQMVTAARTIFNKVVPRAFRHPAEKQEVEKIVNLVIGELENDQPFEDAIKVGLTAVLCAPDFLYLFEPALSSGRVALGDERTFRDQRGRALKGRVISIDGDTFVLQRSSDNQRFTVNVSVFSDADKAYIKSLAKRPAPDTKRPLTDFELASRLSYFVWSSKPDDKLYGTAVSGKLREAEVIQAEVDRMLADPRAEALVSDFASQWLRIHEYDRFGPDQGIFPDFYSNQFTGIGEEMRTEPLEFFREILQKDLSVFSFLDADWTMANERLAKWYGIEGVKGKNFRRVVIPTDSPRGGLLAMAGVHKWGSDGNRTKPVERGKYVLDVLFNDPPPPPPPNAGEVEPNIRGENLTVRERLAKHRHLATCANCHRRIDPYGLALENFNVIGQWRDRQDGEKPLAHWGNNRREIDSSGTLPNGEKFTTFVEFKKAMKGQSDRFLRGLSEKMFVYALGRTLEPSDRTTIDQCVQSMKANGHTLRSLIKTIATSQQFRTK